MSLPPLRPMWRQAYGSLTEATCEVLHYHSVRWKGILLLSVIKHVNPQACGGEDNLSEFKWINEPFREKKAGSLQRELPPQSLADPDLTRLMYHSNLCFLGQPCLHSLPPVVMASCVTSFSETYALWGAKMWIRKEVKGPVKMKSQRAGRTDLISFVVYRLARLIWLCPDLLLRLVIHNQ